VKKITAADVRRAAREIFRNDKLNLAVIGPYRDEEKYVKPLKL